VSLLPCLIQASPAPVCIDRGLRTVLAWRPTPLAGTAQEVNESTADPAQIDRTGIATTIGWRQQGSENSPLSVTESVVCSISWSSVQR
jgi:hypothetical protein